VFYLLLSVNKNGMAVRIERSRLTADYIQLIRDALIIKPEKQFGGPRNRWSADTDNSQPIIFYEVRQSQKPEEILQPKLPPVKVKLNILPSNASSGSSEGVKEITTQTKDNNKEKTIDTKLNVPNVETKTDYIFLPFCFGNMLFKEQINRVNCPRKAKIELKFTGQLRDYQESPYNESLEHLKNFGCTTLRLPPGFGKTILGAKLAAELGYLTLITYHQVTLETIWKKTFNEFTDAKVWVVGESKPPKDVNVILCMNTRVASLPEYFRLMIGTFILDEAHRLCTPSNVKTLLSIEPYYVIAETATLDRPDGLEKMMHAMCGLNHVIRSNDKAFEVVKLLTGIVPEEKRNVDGTLKWSSVVESLATNAKRNSIIINIVKSRKEDKILILCRIKTHVDILFNELKSQGVLVDYMMGNKREYKDSQVLIGTISKIGTGFDEARFCSTYSGIRINLLIQAASVKDVGLLEQNVGRALRASHPKIIHLVDDHKTIHRHWLNAKKWYTTNKGTIHEIDGSSLADIKVDTGVKK
jgi:superfamily II DNA or RNA helicase